MLSLYICTVYTGGYIYFDVFNFNGRTQRLQLVSPTLEPATDRSPTCFSFWFAGFGAENSTLRVYLRPAEQLQDDRLLNDLTEDTIVSRQILYVDKTSLFLVLT